MTGKKIHIFMFALMAVCLNQAHAGLLVNGGFEDPPITQGTFQSVETMPGWTTERVIGFEVWNNQFGYASFDGAQHIELDEYTIQQSFPSIVGENYRLSFSYAPRPGVADNHILVKWGDQTVTEITESGLGASDLDWTTVSFLLSASSSTTTVSFSGLSADPKLGMLVDGIQVVPEPSSLAALLVISSVTIIRRRMA